MMMLMFTLLMSFLTISMMWFYFFFEMSLIPIFWMILSFGYQPERLPASLSLLFYTVTVSLPLLMMILLWFNQIYSLKFSLMLLTSINNYNMLSLNSSISFLPMYMAFLVKIPMYGVHQWLPKAHVEAPVVGSMFLAAILLKLGGYGIYRLNIMMNNFLLKLLIMMFSMFGSFYMCFLCIRQTDMKILIAYSSIAHMGLVISSILLCSVWSFSGSFLIIMGHGFCSSALFLSTNLLYLRTGSRSMLMSKGILNSIPIFSLFWFLMCLSNMSGPPTMNLLGEIYMSMSLFNMNLFFMFPLMLTLFLAVVYTLILYSMSQQGNQNKNIMWNYPVYNMEINNMLIHSYLPIMMSLLLYSLI